jgi:hypothetical protein
MVRTMSMSMLVCLQDALQLDSKAADSGSGELGSDMDDLDDYLTQLDAGGWVGVEEHMSQMCVCGEGGRGGVQASRGIQ